MERLSNSPPGTPKTTPPGQAEKATKPDNPYQRVFRRRSSGNGQAGEQSFESQSDLTIDLTSSPEAPKTKQQRNLKRGLSVDKEEPSTSSAGAGGKKKKAGTSPKPPDKKRGQTSQKGARGKQIDQNDNVVEIGRLNAIVADLNKKNRQLTTENNKLKKTVATKEGLKENNRQLTEENKKLKKTAATNEAVLAKEKAEKEKLKNDVEEMKKAEKLRIAELGSMTASRERLAQEKSDLEKTLGMLQNEVGQNDVLRANNTRLERDKDELEKTMATLQVQAGSQLEDAFRQILECPICFNVPTQVVQCVNSHQICTQCQQKMQECPTCKVAYSAGVHRNRVAEDLAHALNNA